MGANIDMSNRGSGTRRSGNKLSALLTACSLISVLVVPVSAAARKATSGPSPGVRAVPQQSENRTAQSPQAAQQGWKDKTQSPDQRADLVIEQMTLDEKIQLVHGAGGFGPPGSGVGGGNAPPGAGPGGPAAGQQ